MKINFHAFTLFFIFFYEEEVNSEECFETRKFRVTDKDKRQSFRFRRWGRLICPAPGGGFALPSPGAFYSLCTNSTAKISSIYADIQFNTSFKLLFLCNE